MISKIFFLSIAIFMIHYRRIDFKISLTNFFLIFCHCISKLIRLIIKLLLCHMSINFYYTMYPISRKKDTITHISTSNGASFFYYSNIVLYLPGFIQQLELMNYIPICAATSAAKSSCFFSRPSPVSKRTNFTMLMFALFSFATCAIY